MDEFFKIEMMATDIDIILNITNEEWKCNANSAELIKSTNSLISALVKLK
ncbi:hypothetical protein [Clostridium sp. JS66]|nr:hypothetical protein [Clostridium sp. JS66]WPC41052.1 hypothetical protein Q6H37_24650 [Clostridium sp. JS66]